MGKVLFWLSLEGIGLFCSAFGLSMPIGSNEAHDTRTATQQRSQRMTIFFLANQTITIHYFSMS